VEIISYGATIKSVHVPDRMGRIGNVVAGFESLDSYINDINYIGTTIGPVANRIRNASFEMDENIFHLEKNEGVHTNHSGSQGLHKRNFSHRIIGNQLILTTDLLEYKTGFPGNNKFQVIYTWNKNHELQIKYEALTNRKTPLSITNHSYFNLSAFQHQIGTHTLFLNAAYRLEQLDNYLVSGKLKKLPEKLVDIHLEDLISNIDEREIYGNTYYIFNGSKDSQACTLIEHESGRKMDIITSYPGYQFYSGFFLNSKTRGWHQKIYKPYDALCIEPHHYPDFVNHSNFPQAFITPEIPYNEFITFSFSTFQKHPFNAS